LSIISLLENFPKLNVIDGSILQHGKPVDDRACISPLLPAACGAETLTLKVSEVGMFAAFEERAMLQVTAKRTIKHKYIFFKNFISLSPL